MGIYHIISDNKKVASKINVENLAVVVIVHLFYEEQIDFYRNYLDKIPYFIDIVIISSKEIILERFNSGRFKTIKKENRGRDISAFLVAAKDFIFDYEYICFIHDKKEKRPTQKRYVDLWIKNLWDYMLQSTIYIFNLLELFQSTKIGMLVPLPPYGKNSKIWLKGDWGNDFENVKRLANSLNISGNIFYEKPPITYSTVFWAKSETLKKLFSKDWDYTDFPEEPMKIDGEINHAIERILQYVVEDAGYEVKISLSTSFAEDFIERLHFDMNELWDQMDTVLGINNYRGICNYGPIKAFAKEYADIYLYGAGERGKECLRLCRTLNILPKGFIVTEKKDLQEKKELPLFAISDFSFTENMGVIISVSSIYQGSVIKELEKRSFQKYIIYESVEDE